MIQQTSLEAYIELQKYLGKRQRQILEVFRRHGKPMSNRTAADIMNYPLNCVTPRVLELRQRGLLESAGIAIENKRRVMLWKV